MNQDELNAFQVIQECIDAVLNGCPSTANGRPCQICVESAKRIKVEVGKTL